MAALVQIHFKHAMMVVSAPTSRRGRTTPQKQKSKSRKRSGAGADLASSDEDDVGNGNNGTNEPRSPRTNAKANPATPRSAKRRRLGNEEQQHLLDDSNGENGEDPLAKLIFPPSAPGTPVARLRHLAATNAPLDNGSSPVLKLPRGEGLSSPEPVIVDKDADDEDSEDPACGPSRSVFRYRSVNRPSSPISDPEFELAPASDDDADWDYSARNARIEQIARAFRGGEQAVYGTLFYQVRVPGDVETDDIVDEGLLQSFNESKQRALEAARVGSGDEEEEDEALEEVIELPARQTATRDVSQPNTDSQKAVSAPIESPKPAPANLPAPASRSGWKTFGPKGVSPIAKPSPAAQAAAARSGRLPAAPKAKPDLKSAAGPSHALPEPSSIDPLVAVSSPPNLPREKPPKQVPNRGQSLASLDLESVPPELATTIARAGRNGLRKSEPLPQPTKELVAADVSRIRKTAGAQALAKDAANAAAASEPRPKRRLSELGNLTKAKEPNQSRQPANGAKPVAKSNKSRRKSTKSEASESILEEEIEESEAAEEQEPRTEPFVGAASAGPAPSTAKSRKEMFDFVPEAENEHEATPVPAKGKRGKKLVGFGLSFAILSLNQSDLTFLVLTVDSHTSSRSRTYPCRSSD